MNWFILANTEKELTAARATHTPPTDWTPSALGERGSGEGKSYTLTDDVATITIRGVMTETPDWFAQYFGGGNVTYPQIISALREADADPRVKTVDIDLQSPGGSVAGSYEAFTALRDMSKPTRVLSGGSVASAAYMLAAQADTIVATSPMAMFGSVGVVVDAYLSDSVVSVTSTNAPDKRPDLKTEAGRATLRSNLDDIHDVMIKMVADGRGTTSETVNQNFGRGGMMLASKALESGMIDEVKTELAPTRGGKIEATKQESTMDLKTLKASHPETYIAAVNEGKEAGKTQERERAAAHITMGEACGDMTIAMKNISEGAEMSANVNAAYMAASMKRNMQADRQDEAPAATDTPAAKTGGDSIEDQSVDALAAAMGAL